MATSTASHFKADPSDRCYGMIRRPGCDDTEGGVLLALTRDVPPRKVSRHWFPQQGLQPRILDLSRKAIFGH